MKVGVEIGGTFTDLVWVSGDGLAQTGKVPSTPERIHQAVMDAVGEAGIPLSAVERFIHGSTVATNALLTRSGALTGLITTEGFRDIVEIGTHDRFGNIYTSFYRKPRVPVLRRHIHEVPERIAADGTILEPLREDAVRNVIARLMEQGVEAVAICLLHAYCNPEHEKYLAATIRKLAPGIEVFASHEVSPEFREYERSVTTSVNAFVGPVVQRYVAELQTGLKEKGYGRSLQLMQSNGGIMPAGAAGSNAVRMLLSGPAAGVRAASWFARRNGIEDVLTLDMGGTSTDVAIMPGLEAQVVQELTVDGLPIRTTAIDMVTVGAGGGSIATVDTGGFLTVGPASAGALPGPACYGRGGTRPTVTDAQAIAGLLRPEQFFSGKLHLRGDLAEKAIASLDMATPLDARADAILRMVNNNMASAVRLVSTARGIDPRSFTLVAFGGGGPLHGAMVAEDVGMSRVLVPWSPGILSAFGLLVADLIVDVVEAHVEALGDDALDENVRSELTRRCDRVAAELELEPGSYEIEIGLDLRYAGQGFELAVWSRDVGHCSAEELRRAFEDQHRRSYGYSRDTLGVQVVNRRARIVQRNRETVSTPTKARVGAERATGMITLNGERLEATFIERGLIKVGEQLDGPVVIEESTSTTFVPPHWTAECLPTSDLLLIRKT